MNSEVAKVDVGYRNENGIYLRLMNFRACDPYWTQQGKVGMRSGAGGKTAEIWDEFDGDAELVCELASEIKAEVARQQNTPVALRDGSTANKAVSEGKRQLRIHYSRERKSQRRQKLKSFQASHGQLFCEVCKTDASSYPSELRQSVFEVHHITPLHLTDTIVETSLDDLAVLCANCHRAIHSDEEVLSLEQVRSKWQSH
jgi:5-methylcytosine-specific restriction protein A